MSSQSQGATPVRVMRCAMMVTPTNPRFIDKAWTRGADAYILDIEDSIPPHEKERCRGLIRESIGKANRGGASIYVRINKPSVLADLEASIWPGVEGILLPKTESGADMHNAHDIISRLEAERGIPHGHVALAPMIESAQGAVNIHEIITAVPRRSWSVAGGGGYDMAVNLGIEMFAGFDQYAFPMAYVALAEMSVGIKATGGVFIHNPTGRVDQSEHATREAAKLHAAGIRQAGALHPSFVEPLVSGLSATPAEIEWAHKVIAAYSQLQAAGESIGTLDGRPLDKYEYALALDTLDWSAACAAKDRFKAECLARALADGTKSGEM